MSKRIAARMKTHVYIQKSNKKQIVSRFAKRKNKEKSKRINKAKKSPTKGKFKTIFLKKVLRSSST